MYTTKETKIKIDKLYKVGLYIRLSRDDGDDLESESISNQRILLNKYLSDNNLELVSEYVDDGYSGGNFNRPGFVKLIKDIESKKINMVITKDLSRLGRDYIGTGHYIEKYFPENNIRYIAINDDIDSIKESSGSDMMPFKLSMNDMYAKDISKKVRSTLIALKQQGKFLGSTPSFGYTRDPNDKYKLIPDDNAKVVKRIFEMYHSGVKTSVIAKMLTEEKIPTPVLVKNNSSRIGNACMPYIWKHTTVNNILKNLVYTGCLIQHTSTNISYKIKKRKSVPKENWIIVENTHEAIIDKKLFNLVQMRRNKANNYDENRRKTDYLLSGFIKCKDCSSSMSISYDKKRDRTTTNCSSYRKFSKYGICSSHFINYNKLEELVINRLKEICKVYVDPTKFENILKNKIISPLDEVNNKIISYKIKINKLTLKLDNLYDDKFNNIIDTEMYVRLSKNIKEEIEKLKNELKSLEEEKNSLINDDASKLDYMKIANDFLKMNNPTKEIMNKLINTIYIHKDKTVEIHYRIRDFKFI